MFSCLQILEAFLWFVLITLLNVTLIILTLSVSRLLNLLLRLVAFLLFLNPQCLASISRWITASSSWKRFCLFVCRALSSRMVIGLLTAKILLLTFFFFQAEDGIRYLTVTGVQTCALPIFGRRQVAVRHGGPDERRRDRLPVVRHGRDDVHRKPVLARQPPHHLYVARAPAPEPMVVPQNQLLHPEARPQHVAHELLGSEPRQLRRERHHLDPLDAERRRQHPLLVGQREQPRRGAPVQDRKS